MADSYTDSERAAYGQRLGYLGTRTPWTDAERAEARWILANVPPSDVVAESIASAPLFSAAQRSVLRAIFSHPAGSVQGAT